MMDNTPEITFHIGFEDVMKKGNPISPHERKRVQEILIELSQSELVPQVLRVVSYSRSLGEAQKNCNGSTFPFHAGKTPSAHPTIALISINLPREHSDPTFLQLVANLLELGIKVGILYKRSQHGGTQPRLDRHKTVKISNPNIKLIRVAELKHELPHLIAQ